MPCELGRGKTPYGVGSADRRRTPITLLPTHGPRQRAESGRSFSDRLWEQWWLLKTTCLHCELTVGNLFQDASVGGLRRSVFDQCLASTVVYLDQISGLWEGYHESRKCSRDTYPGSYITKYTGIRREISFKAHSVEEDHRPHGWSMCAACVCPCFPPSRATPRGVPNQATDP